MSWMGTCGHTDPPLGELLSLNSFQGLEPIFSFDSATATIAEKKLT